LNAGPPNDAKELGPQVLVATPVSADDKLAPGRRLRKGLQVPELAAFVPNMALRLLLRLFIFVI